jgi:glucose-6-phosphate 1-dehydrogenase
MDVVRGNQTLFVRRDELNAAWKWVAPIMQAWDASSESPELYAAGSSGPDRAGDLIEAGSVGWIEDC